MKRALTIEQMQDVMLVVFTWAVRFANTHIHTEAARIRWLESICPEPAQRRALHAAIKRKEAARCR